MSDFCYECDGTGEADFLSGEPCRECCGTGWKEDVGIDDYDDVDEEFWDEFYDAGYA